MNTDDVIPPSPTVNKTSGRSKHRNASRHKKNRLSIRSMRTKILEESNGNKQNAPSTSSSGECVVKNTIQKDREINIYAGLENISIDQQVQTQSLLKGFDILGQSKLIENCNDFDMSQRPEVKPNRIVHQFSQTCGLVSLKELLQSTRNEDFVGQPVAEIQSPLPNIRNTSEDEAKEISRENIQFSEWPFANDFVLNCSNESVTIEQTTTHSTSNEPSIVQSILDDFNDGNSSQEEIAQTPPFILIRRAHRKTYKRIETAPLKTLLFEDLGSQQHSPGAEEVEIDCDGDVDGAQCSQDHDIDIDLNSSRRIVENLTQLSSFFTQPQSYELDFNTDLSHTIPNFEMKFDEFVSDSDDFQSGLLQTSLCDDEFGIEPGDESNVTETQSKNEHYTNTELLNLDDDLFMNIDTPKGEQRIRNVKRNPVEISTPLSSTKTRVEDSDMHSTPSTSKQAIASEQRVPKRLQFATETDQTENHIEHTSTSTFQTSSKMVGFSTARGGSIQMTAASVKRTACLFANIDNDYGHIDPSHAPNPKRVKQHENVAIPSLNQIIDSNLLATNQKDTPERPQFSGFTGFRTAAGKSGKLSETAANKARNIFGEEDFSDLRLKQPAPEFKPAIAGPSHINVIKNGFTTARGSNIEVTENNLQKYRQTLKDVDRSVGEEFGIKEDDSIFNENPSVCKTPLAKLNQRPKLFATSTPNPNATHAFKNYPPVTPINKNVLAEHKDFTSWVDQLDGDTFDEMFVENTQQLTAGAHGRNTSVNLNDTITSDIQAINDSITGIDVLNISEEVKSGRRKALCEQQTDCFKKPQPIRPLLGWLFVQKILSSKKLAELGQPKKYQRDQLERIGVQPNVIDLNVNNVLQFKFDMWHFYPMDVCQNNVEGVDVHDYMRIIMDDNSRVGVKEITSAFLQCPSVDPKLVPDHWIENALKCIIVKLASYERSFPETFAGKCLTPENVLAQLKYRYDREIDKVQRSAIRKIVEKDDTAAKRMVLFVSRIIEHSFVYSFELSDGWYSISTSCLDSVLSNAITKRKIVVGTKLVIQGAELVGIEEGCSPLEMPCSVALKISANSTRRARWYTKLGYCKQSWPFAISLNSVHGNGGIITRTKAYILRVYPLVFAVKEKSGDSQRTVFRSNKVEQRQGKKDDKKQFEIIEKFYSEASEEIDKEYEMERKRYKPTKKKIGDIDNGEELWNFMEYSNDSVSFEVDLTATQKKLLSDYQTKFYDDKQNKIAAIVRAKLGERENPTKSTPLQKVRLIDATAPNASKTAILSIWNANDSHGTLRENTFLDLQHVTANGMRGKDVQLTASSFTILREIQSMTSTSHEQFARKLTQLSDIDPQQFRPDFSEFDTLGFVLKIEEPVPNQFQSVFIVDAVKNIFCIKFWGNINQYAYDDIVQERKFIVICQLEWRSHIRLNAKGHPQAFVTEITTFSESPKSSERISALNHLREQFDQFDLAEYIDDCLEKMDQGMQSNKENSNVNISSKSHDQSANQSAHNQSVPGTSTAGKPVLGVQQKIERLRHVGSPPAFRSSYLNSSKLNQSGSRKPFKNPSRVQKSTDN